MGAVELKKSLIAKTITNLEADITRKGTWAYQNALALESLVSSDKFLNDKVLLEENVKKEIKNAKDLKIDVSVPKYVKELPNRCNENQYLKELSNGELVFFNRSSSEKTVFLSRDGGTTWEIILNKVIEKQDDLTQGLETGHFDIEFINGHYYMAWTGTTAASERLFVGKIANGDLIEVEEIVGGSTALTDVSISADMYGRPVVIYKNNKVLYLAVKQSDGKYVLVNVNYSTADETYFSRNYYVDENGFFWLVQVTNSQFAVTRVDLSSQDTNPTTAFFVEHTGESMTNKTIFGAFWKGNTVLILRYGKNALLFNTKEKDFIDTNIVVTNVAECITVDKNFNVIVGRNYTSDLGKTWKTLPLNKTYIQTSMSNVYPNSSNYRSYITYAISDTTTVALPHCLVRVEDILSNDEIIL